jgi:flagellar protein FliO/FliZ
MTLRSPCLALLAFAIAAASCAGADDAKAAYLAGAAALPASAAAGDPGMGSITVVGAFVLAGVGGWLLLRGRKLQLPGRSVRKLAIDETRSLGSRQYLVVASYEGRKLLLGVCPGRIDLITPLDGAVTLQKSP